MISLHNKTKYIQDSKVNFELARFLKKEFIEIKNTGSMIIHKLNKNEGWLMFSLSSVNSMGVEGIFFKVIPNNHPDKIMAGMDMTIPNPKVALISAPGRCVTK